MTNQFLFSLITGIFIGGIAGYLGSLMVTKRMALVGDALGHVALPGMGLALMLRMDVSLGAFLFLFFGILVIWLFELKTSLPTEALVGVVFVASLAVGFLLIPEPELLHALIGDITQVSFGTTLISAVSAVLIFLILRRFYSGMILANISEDLARTEGVKIKKQNFIYLFLIAAIVALGIKVTGSLLVGALVIIPAVAARNLSKNLKFYTWGSLLLGSLSALLGIVLYKLFGLPAGPLIVLVSVIFFLISFLFKD